MDFVLRHIAKRYLKRQARRHMRTFPQYACHAFDFITLQIHLDGAYELPYLQGLAQHVFRHLPQRRTCLDIGANIGNHSLFFARHFERVVSFEPNPQVFQLLAINAQMAGNVEAHELGLSDAEGEVHVRVPRRNTGAASLQQGASISSGRQDEDSYDAIFRLRRLDDFWHGRTERVDFVKMDVEGHEARCIAGAAQLLARDKPVVVLEILGGRRTDALQPLHLLRELGYAHFMALERPRLAGIKWGVARLRPLSLEAPPKRSIKMAVCSAQPLGAA